MYLMDNIQHMPQDALHIYKWPSKPSSTAFHASHIFVANDNYDHNVYIYVLYNFLLVYNFGFNELYM